METYAPLPWEHVLAFLSLGDAARLAGALPPSSRRRGLECVLCQGLPLDAEFWHVNVEVHVGSAVYSLIRAACAALPPPYAQHSAPDSAVAGAMRDFVARVVQPGERDVAWHSLLVLCRSLEGLSAPSGASVDMRGVLVGPLSPGSLSAVAILRVACTAADETAAAFAITLRALHKLSQPVLIQSSVASMAAAGERFSLWPEVDRTTQSPHLATHPLSTPTAPSTASAVALVGRQRVSQLRVSAGRGAGGLSLTPAALFLALDILLSDCAPLAARRMRELGVPLAAFAAPALATGLVGAVPWPQPASTARWMLLLLCSDGWLAWLRLVSATLCAVQHDLSEARTAGELMSYLSVFPRRGAVALSRLQETFALPSLSRGRVAGALLLAAGRLPLAQGAGGRGRETDSALPYEVYADAMCGAALGGASVGRGGSGGDRSSLVRTLETSYGLACTGLVEGCTPELLDILRPLTGEERGSKGGTTLPAGPRAYGPATRRVPHPPYPPFPSLVDSEGGLHALHVLTLPPGRRGKGGAATSVVVRNRSRDTSSSARSRGASAAVGGKGTASSKQGSRAPSPSAQGASDETAAGPAVLNGGLATLLKQRAADAAAGRDKPSGESSSVGAPVLGGRPPLAPSSRTLGAGGGGEGAVSTAASLGDAPPHLLRQSESRWDVGGAGESRGGGSASASTAGHQDGYDGVHTDDEAGWGERGQTLRESAISAAGGRGLDAAAAPPLSGPAHFPSPGVTASVLLSLGIHDDAARPRALPATSPPPSIGTLPLPIIAPGGTAALLAMGMRLAAPLLTPTRRAPSLRNVAQPSSALPPLPSVSSDDDDVGLPESSPVVSRLGLRGRGEGAGGGFSSPQPITQAAAASPARPKAGGGVVCGSPAPLPSPARGGQGGPTSPRRTLVNVPTDDDVAQGVIEDSTRVLALGGGAASSFKPSTVAKAAVREGFSKSLVLQSTGVGWEGVDTNRPPSPLAQPRGRQDRALHPEVYSEPSAYALAPREAGHARPAADVRRAVMGPPPDTDAYPPVKAPTSFDLFRLHRTGAGLGGEDGPSHTSGRHGLAALSSSNFTSSAGAAGGSSGSPAHAQAVSAGLFPTGYGDSPKDRIAALARAFHAEISVLAEQQEQRDPPPPPQSALEAGGRDGLLSYVRGAVVPAESPQRMVHSGGALGDAFTTVSAAPAGVPSVVAAAPPRRSPPRIPFEARPLAGRAPGTTPTLHVDDVLAGVYAAAVEIGEAGWPTPVAGSRHDTAGTLPGKAAEGGARAHGAESVHNTTAMDLVSSMAGRAGPATHVAPSPAAPSPADVDQRGTSRLNHAMRFDDAIRTAYPDVLSRREGMDGRDGASSLALSLLSNHGGAADAYAHHTSQSGQRRRAPPAVPPPALASHSSPSSHLCHGFSLAALQSALASGRLSDVLAEHVPQSGGAGGEPAGEGEEGLDAVFVPPGDARLSAHDASIATLGIAPLDFQRDYSSSRLLHGALELLASEREQEGRGEGGGVPSPSRLSTTVGILAAGGRPSLLSSSPGQLTVKASPVSAASAVSSYTPHTGRPRLLSELVGTASGPRSGPSTASARTPSTRFQSPKAGGSRGGGAHPDHRTAAAVLAELEGGEAGEGGGRAPLGSPGEYAGTHSPPKPFGLPSWRTLGVAAAQ